jgi:hypothetical protein
MFKRALICAAAAALALPAAAGAAERPTVVTGAASSVGESTVVLSGRVNPRGAETTYFFQYGPTIIYGGTTPAASAGAGTRPVRVAVNVAGLAPATRYHYRLVAQNARGLARGGDRTFATRRQPLGVSLTAAPNPVRPDEPIVLSGTLTGTGSAGRQVVLQANPFPYTQGFLPIVNPQVTNATGGFSFPLLGIGVTTQYRVLMPQRPEVVSPVVVAGVKVKVVTGREVDQSGRGARVQIKGRVTPAIDGAEIQIQKRRDGGPWRTIERTFARDRSETSSSYSKTFRQRRTGKYRVLANAQGAYVPNLGKEIRIVVK